MLISWLLLLKFNSILTISNYITYLTEIIPLIFCITFFKKIYTNTLKVFFIYAITSVIFVTVSLLSLSYYDSFFLYMSSVRIFLVLEFILICFFYKTIFKSARIKKLLTVLPIIFILFCLYNFLKSSKTEFDFAPLVIECLFFTVVILYYFYERIMYNFTIPLYQLPSFWISVAFLIYFSGNFFLFLFSKVIENDPGFANQYTLIYSSITIIKNILLCTALIVNRNLIVTKDISSVIPNLSIENFETVQ